MRKTHPKKKCPNPLYAWNFAWESIENSSPFLGQKYQIHLMGEGREGVKNPLVLAGRACYMKSVDFFSVAGGVAGRCPESQRFGWTVSTTINVIPEDDGPQVPEVSVTLGNSWKWCSSPVQRSSWIRTWPDLAELLW